MHEVMFSWQWTTYCSSLISNCRVLGQERTTLSYSMKIVNWNVYMRVPMCTNGSWAIRSAKQLCEKSGQAKPKTVRRTITSMNSFGLINRVADQLVTQVRSFVFCAKTFSGSCWNLEIIPRRWRPTASDMLFSIHMQMFKKRLKHTASMEE